MKPLRLRPQYAELLAKSCYSFLRGASQPSDLIQQGAKLGLTALALSDRGGVYGIPKAYLAQKDAAALGLHLKLITGAEIPLNEKESITLLVRDRRAYGLLCKMLTEAHRDRPKAKPELNLEQLSKFLSQTESQGFVGIVNSDLTPATIERVSELLRDRLALPLGRFLDGVDKQREAKTREISLRYGIPIFATNDVRFHAKEKRPLHDVLTSIRIGKPCKDAGFELHSNAERYLKSPREMHFLFRDIPESIDCGLEIAESCTFSPSELKYRYPSEWIPAPHTAMSYLESLVWEGAQERYQKQIPENVTKQLLHELALIRELEFADYFLTVDDIVRWARKQGILCQGRGSAANSSVCFCLGITSVDPVKMRLLFERFISKERGEPPDIDVDFEHERREEVIQYVYKKYGRDRAAMVSAVITYRSRSALREVGKALGLEVGAMSSRKMERAFKEQLENNPTLKTKIEALCAEIKGTPRHLSIHSGGFTLSADPITEIVPVEPAAMEGRTIVQWDKYDLDILGLLKIDLLSLGMLSALRKSLELTGKSLHELPAEDPETFEQIRAADTIGVFQIESRAQMSMLPRLLPKTFYDLVIEVAIVRPGPIVGQMVHPYLRRRRGQEKVEYPDPRLRPILERTLGIPLFQEQVMQMAIELAGFSPGEADQLRRAIGAWRSSGSVSKISKRLIDGLLKSGISDTYAELIHQQIQGFAEYGFPESHAVSFALISYGTAYMKCHHPAEFTASLVNSQPLGFYQNHTLIDDAKRHGVEIRPVHPQVSQWDCTLEEGAIQLGFRIIAGLSKKDFDRMDECRRQQAFRGLSDFVIRSKFKTDVLRKMALGDAFRCFGIDQRNAVWDLLSIQYTKEKNSSDQLNLFAPVVDSISPSSQLFNPLSHEQSIHDDYQAFGLSVRGHPMEAVRKRAKGIPQTTAQAVKELKTGSIVEIAGLAIVMQRPPTAKGTVFATLEDETGLLDLILWKNVFEDHRELILHHGMLIVKGELQRDGKAASLLVKSLRTFALSTSEKKSCFSETFPRLLSEGICAPNL